MQLGPTELLIVLVIVIIIFGVGRLGDVGAALGKSIREFRRAAQDENEEAKVKEPTDANKPAA